MQQRKADAILKYLKQIRIDELLVVPILEPVKAAKRGLRRSKRVRFKPLKWWANEHVNYSKQILTMNDIKNNNEILNIGIDRLDINNKRKNRIVKEKISKNKKDVNNESRKQHINVDIMNELKLDYNTPVIYHPLTGYRLAIVNPN